MVLSYHSVFLVPCVPFLCSVPFHVPSSCVFVRIFIHWVCCIVSLVWSVSIFGLFGISPDIPRYLKYGILPDTVEIYHDSP